MKQKYFSATTKTGVYETHALDVEPVFAQNPIADADGRPQMKEVTQHLEAKPYSKLGQALKWGLSLAAAGAVAAGVTGLVVGAVIPTLAIGATSLAAAGIGAVAGGGAGSAAGVARGAKDQVKIVWEKEPIRETRMSGFRYEVKQRHENTGIHPDDESYDTYYTHRFVSQLRTQEAGEGGSSYYRPKVVHLADTVK